MGGMALSRDGQLIASCDDEGYVNAWHGDTGRPLTQSFRAHSKSCSLDFSPDGATLGTGSLDCTTKLWSTVTWQLQGELINCTNPVNVVRYSPNGELLAIATNRNVQIWNTVTRQHVVCIDLTVPSVIVSNSRWSCSYDRASYSLVWTPDGTRLLSMCNPTILEWDSSTWKQVSEVWRGQTGIAVSYDGTLVAYATADNHVRVRRLSDRRTIAIFQHSDSPCCITFSMDGKYILAGGKDKKIFQWAVPQHAWPEDALTDQATYQVCSRSFFNSPSHFFVILRFRNVTPRIRALNIRCGLSLVTQTIRACLIIMQIFAMDTEVRSACISGDLPTAEELLTKAIDANVDNYRPYAVRSVVMARKLDWDHALRDATKVSKMYRPRPS
jgi:WD40 repeat protein